MKTRRENLHLLLVVSLYFAFQVQVAAQNCPACYNNRDLLINRWGIPRIHARRLAFTLTKPI